MLPQSAARLLALTVNAILVMTISATAPLASRSGQAWTPVIGRPVAVPATPVPGQRFVASFKVTRSDRGTPLTRGRMICDPSIASLVIGHAESFRGGTARLSLVVPADAAGKLLKVKLTIRVAGRSQTRTASFRVRESSVPVTPGPYLGLSQYGGPVELRVLRDRTLTSIRVAGVPVWCDGPPKFAGFVDYGALTLPIGADGSFGHQGSKTGSVWDGDVEWTRIDFKIAGQFHTATSVGGAVIENYELNIDGRHYRCSSGEVKWCAGYGRLAHCSFKSTTTVRRE